MLIPVILSGGAGSRLWPVSREMRPKPFMKLADGYTLLQKTFQRAASLKNVTDILTVTNREYYFETKDEYQKVNTDAYTTSFLLEPVGRNTAPAITLAALSTTEKHGKDAIMVILAADHLIQNHQAFSQAIAHATDVAQQGNLVTFGIQPSCPETGFGYIECGTPWNESAFRVARFVEKPNAELAQQYLDSGQYFWNSGMFCFTAGNILEQLKLHAPALLDKAYECWEISKNKAPDTSVIEIDLETFKHHPDISIDYAVMEKAENVAVIPCDIGWNDIGSWNAISDLLHPDESGNRVVGEALLVDVQNSYIQSEQRLVAAVGVENLIIVDTADAILVADRDHTQEVKQVVEQLKKIGHECHKIHRTVHRPWGTYTVLEEGDHFKIKRIVVKPGATLSLQMHHHRSEHWIVVRGIARVVKNEESFLINTNESTFIPAGHPHRLENPGVIDLVLIEVQSGEYLGEDDIVRYDDKYGRV